MSVPWLRAPVPGSLSAPARMSGSIRAGMPVLPSRPVATAPTRRLLRPLIVALSSTLLLVAGMAPATAAGSWPTRPVRIVVPYATGGGSDVLARQLAARLQALWGQGVVVENRAGASGIIGTDSVVRAPADGHTLLLQNSTMVVNPAVGGKPNYDPERDLAPIMLLGQTPIALAAHPDAGIRNLAELVAAAKARPLSYGSCGAGTPQHFVMELLKQKTGFAATHVGYKGCQPGVTDVLGGQVPLAIVSANLIVPHLKAGRLRAVGVSTARRYPLLPETPTFEEQGLRPLDFSIWYALMGPAQLPADIVAKIEADTRRVLAEVEVRERLSQAGVEPMDGDGTALAQLISADLARYADLARAAGIKTE
jgi:tripartite-type tricarboxylate transporter receptor subunit TctC